jgi:hypothetical protein
MKFFGLILPLAAILVSYFGWKLSDLVEVKDTRSKRAADGTVAQPSDYKEDAPMKTTDQTASIATSFRRLVLILSVPSGVFSLFLVFIMAFMIYAERDVRHTSDKVEIVVAKTNLVAGAVMSRDNLGTGTFRSSSLKTQDYVAVKDAKVILGHQLTKPVGFGEPITWHNTDIVITNKTHPQ